MKTLGICFGATTLQYVKLYTESDLKTVIDSGTIIHEGNVRKAFLDFISGCNRYEFNRIAVTGRNFRNSVNLTGISEPRAMEYAVKSVFKSGEMPEVVVSLGGETEMVYRFDTEGNVASVDSGNKCASGTGEFYIQQLRRMGLSLEDANSLTRESEPYAIAGRCSVFCKSDCTHALNKGASRGEIAAGLCSMMADKIIELTGSSTSGKLVLTGGGVLNSKLVELLRRKYGSVSVPEMARTFEAYGAALWAADNTCIELAEDIESLTGERKSQFNILPPVYKGNETVEYKESRHGSLKEGDKCLLGLDVGSTTTKAVLLREKDFSICGSVYLRTEGDPIEASRKCYRELENQLDGITPEIRGIGVTGSGRQIAGLHAMTEAVVNEIVAHARASAFFDGEVDTIFEIGGQDAKYTFLTNGTASDYAMNEACSAGTGSFLEEAAYESMNVKTEDIAGYALRAENPPNFSDQCAAFISSDIKRAEQEGMGRSDILAGVVYSICMNYLNRVKNNRPVGKKIFMQGGVCYNRAVPAAMSILLGKQVIVPPDPGLMGAFGVALEVHDRIESGLIEEKEYDLKSLSVRDAVKEGSFICRGGKEKCDRKCEIARYRIEGEVYPFGGICSRYYNLRLKRSEDYKGLNLVKERQQLLFEKYRSPELFGHNSIDRKNRKKIGINYSLLTHSLFPLYYTFFRKLGFDVVLSEKINHEGMSKCGADYCLPVEFSHGGFFDLLQQGCDYIFVPQVMQIPVKNVPTYSRACVFTQGEPYYLKTAFREEIEKTGVKVLSPVLKMQFSYESAFSEMADLFDVLEVDRKEAGDAFLYACDSQRAFDKELKRRGKEVLHNLKKDNSRYAVVLFGRPYNAFPSEANMGIPDKLASMGYTVIPHDMLPVDEYDVHKKMFWAMGQKIMKGAQMVRDNKNLFGVFITNFSCGPDSFLLKYFQECMGQKPSLTLELDQHTADAGIETRIEAALDVFSSYFREQTKNDSVTSKTFIPARMKSEDSLEVITSSGEVLPITDERVEVIVPSFGRSASRLMAAVLRSSGINARALPEATQKELNEAKKNASGKECLPFIVNTGSYLTYLREKKDPEKITLLAMATGGGPCRLGQYCRAFEMIIRKERIENTAMLAISDENGYGGLGRKMLLKAWQGLILSDIMSDIRSLLRVAAKDPESALDTCDRIWDECIAYFEGKLSVRFYALLSLVVCRLKSIPLKKDPSSIPVISLVGEIFVRRDEFSRKNLVEYLENHGFAVQVAPLTEYMSYSNFVINSGLGERKFSFRERALMRITAVIQERTERSIKKKMAESGLYKIKMNDIRKTVEGIEHLLDPNFRGECILTVGMAMREIIEESCGVVSIGPFGCMYSRMAEAILKTEMSADGKKRMKTETGQGMIPSDTDTLPFLSIEADGGAFNQLTEARLEAFVMQARTLYGKQKKEKGRTLRKYMAKV